MSQRISPDIIKELKPNEVFVFGSNMAGIHGKGAAKTALQWGAKYGCYVGLQGNTYAIPTKDFFIKTSLQLPVIQSYVTSFIDFAKTSPSLLFLVTEIGCGLAGYTPQQIAPLFQEALLVTNIFLPKSFICAGD